MEIDLKYKMSQIYFRYPFQSTPVQPSHPIPLQLMTGQVLVELSLSGTAQEREACDLLPSLSGHIWLFLGCKFMEEHVSFCG